MRNQHRSRSHSSTLSHSEVLEHIEACKREIITSFHLRVRPESTALVVPKSKAATPENNRYMDAYIFVYPIGLRAIKADVPEEYRSLVQQEIETWMPFPNFSDNTQ